MSFFSNLPTLRRLLSPFGACLLGVALLSVTTNPVAAQPSEIGKDTPVPAAEAPDGVDQALRSRVTAFFDLTMQKSRKAIDYVAEETKDEYFASGKMDIKKFTIEKTSYSPDFKQATVLLDVARTWVIQTDVMVVTLPMATTWKLEDGKWSWYHDHSKDQFSPMTGLFGPSKPVAAADAVELIHQDADGTVRLPADFAKPEVVAAHAAAILSKGGLDKSEVHLLLDRPSEDRVVFHNAQPGFVSLGLSGFPTFPGLSVTLDKTEIGANEDAVLLLRYVPPAASDVPLPGSFSARVVMEPFGRPMPVNVLFTPSGTSAAK